MEEDKSKSGAPVARALVREVGSWTKRGHRRRIKVERCGLVAEEVPGGKKKEDSTVNLMFQCCMSGWSMVACTDTNKMRDYEQT